MAVDELKRKRSFGDAASASVDASVQQIPTGASRPVPPADGSQDSPLNTELGRNVTNTMNALPGTQGLRLGGLAERAIAPAAMRLAAPAAQPATWELVGEGGQLATQGARAAAPAATALPGSGGQLARAATDVATRPDLNYYSQQAIGATSNAAPALVAPAAEGQLARAASDLVRRPDLSYYSQPELGNTAGAAAPALAAPSGPLGRAAALVPPQATSALQSAAQAAPVAAGAGIGAAMIAGQSTGTPTESPLQTPKFGTASPPVSTGGFRGNAGRGDVNPANAATLPDIGAFGADNGRGTANDPRRLDMDPSRQSLGAARDFTAELGQVPRNLPADLRQGVVVKTIDPATGRTTYSGRNVGQDANGQTQMVDGSGRDLSPLGQPKGNFVEAVDARGRPTSFAAPGMDGGISLNGLQKVNGGGNTLAAAALASPYPGISAQNNSAADALAARNDGSLEARALANKTLYDQQVASAQALNQAEYERNNPLTKNQIAARQIAATTAINAASEAGANARAALKDRGDTTRTQIEANTKAFGATPPGYRLNASGSLERIPGGPADDQKQLAFNTDTAQLAGLNSSFDRLGSAANAVLAHPGLTGISGLRGSLPNIPGSQAADAAALLTTLKSQVGFGVLQDMRNNSKSGGALGAVSDAENKMLQSNMAALDKAQSLDQFKTSLQAIIDQSNQAKARADVAYRTKNAAFLGGQQPGAAPAASPAAPAQRTVVRSGMHDGKKVTQFSDGSIEYAN